MNNTNNLAPMAVDLVVDALDKYSNKPCIVTGGFSATYSDIKDLSSQICQALHAKGLSRGSRVAVLSSNVPEILPLLIACFVEGIVLSQVNPVLSLDDNVFILEDLEVDALIYDYAFCGERSDALRQLFPDLLFLGLGSDQLGPNLLALYKEHKPKALVINDFKRNEVAFIDYTSATTGRVKGVLYSHDMVSHIAQTQDQLGEYNSSMRMLAVLPLVKVLISLMTPVMQNGGSFYPLRGFSPDRFFDAIKDFNITATLVYPTMLNLMLSNEARVNSVDMSSMKTIYYVGAAINVSTISRLIKAWGKKFYQLYGLTETGFVSVLLREEHDVDNPKRLSSAGRPIIKENLAIFDEDGRPVQMGEIGEVCLRGPTVTIGYHKSPELTEKVIRSGWYHTGDVGRFDSEGYLYIVDRIKDIIISGGLNIYSSTIESVLCEHAAVSQAAVIGMPDEILGEAVKAVVVMNENVSSGAVYQEALADWVSSKKGKMYCPKYFEFVDALPVTPIGKINKKQLREEHLQQQT